MAPKRAPPRAAEPADPRVKKDCNAIKKAYLVTIPHPRKVLAKRVGKKTPPRPYPGQFSREDIERIFLDSAVHPMYDSAGGHAGSVELKQMAIFMELHKPDPDAAPDQVGKVHFHIALQAQRSFRFQPMKRAIRLRHGLETHWSCDHPGYFSAIR